MSHVERLYITTLTRSDTNAAEFVISFQRLDSPGPPMIWELWGALSGGLVRHTQEVPRTNQVKRGVRNICGSRLAAGELMVEEERVGVGGCGCGRRWGGMDGGGGKRPSDMLFVRVVRDGRL